MSVALYLVSEALFFTDHRLCSGLVLVKPVVKIRLTPHLPVVPEIRVSQKHARMSVAMHTTT